MADLTGIKQGDTVNILNLCTGNRQSAIVERTTKQHAIVNGEKFRIKDGSDLIQQHYILQRTQDTTKADLNHAIHSKIKIFNNTSKHTLEVWQTGHDMFSLYLNQKEINKGDLDSLSEDVIKLNEDHNDRK